MWTSRAPFVVDEHVLYRLEPDERPLGAFLGLIGVVMEAAFSPVEDEPASFPLADGGAGAQLGQVAVTGARCQLDVRTLVDAMTGRLDETPQVQVAVANRQIARQRTCARLQQTSRIKNERS